MATAPLIVIVGPTASGKTALAVELATRFGGEIICADSRTVYKGMDIGTAKPTRDEQRQVFHWGLDLVEPDSLYTAADFQSYATKAIAHIRDKGKIPFLVGGSGLYVNGVIFDYEFGDKADAGRRKALEAMSLEELYIYCKKNNIKLPQNNKNKRYVIRAIEQKGINNRSRQCPIDNTYVVGITTNKNILRTRMKLRIEHMFANGLVKEAKLLGEKYGWHLQSMTGNVYPLVYKYISNELTQEELIDQALAQDWRLAKRQLTWFRRNPHIQWAEIDDVRRELIKRLETWRQS
jgi:tRNA dimethylallyltransferase